MAENDGALGQVGKKAEKVAESFDYLEKSIKNVETAVSGISKSVLTGGNSMKALSDGIDNVSSSAINMTSALSSASEVIPGFGKAGSAIENVGVIFKGITGIVSSFVGAINDVAGVMDGLTGINRNMTESLFGSAAGFGESLSEAKLYKDMVLSMASDFATKDFGFIRLKETKEMFEASRSAKLSMEDLTKTVSAGGASMEAYAAGILQAQSMGLNLTRYSELLGDAIYGQGLETKEAMTQLSLFRDISKDTGVALDDVTGTLDGVSRSFRQMGIRADFGEPILRGFAASLKDIGLGAENAGKLTQNLTSSISKIASDPALAYITSKFGDLGYGAGGTALGASIDMQAKLLDAEKTGDQSAVGLELATAMRDTLSQVTGGQGIVTVSEASENPALEAAFYQQQKLLEGIFGVDKNSSARTLEMLAQLEEATRTGDTELATRLATDLAEGKNVRNETRGWQEAMSAKVDGIFAELSTQTSLQTAHMYGLTGIDELAEILTNVNGSMSAEELEDLLKTSGRVMQDSFGSSNNAGGPGFPGDELGGQMSIDLSPMKESYDQMIAGIGRVATSITDLANALESSGVKIPGALGRNN